MNAERSRLVANMLRDAAVVILAGAMGAISGLGGVVLALACLCLGYGVQAWRRGL